MGNPPVHAGWWAIDDPARGAGDGIGALAVRIAGGQVARHPWATGVVVVVLVGLVLRLGTRHGVGDPLAGILRVDHDEVVVFRKMAGRVFRGIDLLPDDGGDEVPLAENLVHDRPQMGLLVVVDGNPDAAVLGQQPSEQLQTRVHHAQPLVVAAKILAILAHHLTKPFDELRVIDVVVVDPRLVAGVVGRIDVDAANPPLVLGQQGLERLQVVAVDDGVGGGVGAARVTIEGVMLVKHPHRHFEVMVDHLFLSFPDQFGHGIGNLFPTFGGCIGQGRRPLPHLVVAQGTHGG